VGEGQVHGASSGGVHVEHGGLVRRVGLFEYVHSAHQWVREHLPGWCYSVLHVRSEVVLAFKHHSLVVQNSVGFGWNRSIVFLLTIRHIVKFL